MKLAPTQRLIVDYLADGEWHCMANAKFYMKDDRTRISELNRKGYIIEGKMCDQCGNRHSSRILMRRMTDRPKAPKVEIVMRDGQLTAVIS